MGLNQSLLGPYPHPDLQVMLRTYLIQNLPDPHGPEPVPSGPISSSRPTGYSTAEIELMGYIKKGYQERNSCIPFPKG